jgi:hypothetical protein
VADVNVPDGTSFGPSTNFTKTWRIKNIGTCTWTTNYSLVFVSGEKLGGPDSVKFTSTIGPNTTFDISVNLTSPAANGTYRGYWQFKNDKGQLFGIGAGGSKPFWVEIKVSGGITPAPTTPSPSGSVYDFAANASSATWTSGAGTLTFPGTDGDAKGFGIKLDSVQMETGNTDSRPALLTVPQNVTNGYIQGVYPDFRVQSGDRFQATVGCQSGATACYVNYKLNYQIGSGAVKTFWSFNEKYEGLVYNVNLNLSSLAGQDVKFILRIGAAGSAVGDRAVWVNPRITRVGAGSTATPTPTGTPLSPTVTPTPTGTPTVTPTATGTTTSSRSNWSIYLNSRYGFSFKFPPGSSVVSQTDNSGEVQLPLLTAGTNLVSKYLEVTVLENSPTNCSGPYGGTASNVTINGIAFVKEVGQDQGAGQIHDWEAYSTVRNNNCITMGFILHSTNPDNYPTPPPEYNKAAESAIFMQILQTFAGV